MDFCFLSVFKRIETRARRSLLLRMIHEMIDYFKSKSNQDFDFFDLLQLLILYIVRQEKLEVDSNCDWGKINHFLRAAVELKGGKGNDSLGISNQAAPIPTQQLLRIEMFALYIKDLESEHYHFSDLLKALSAYASIKMERHLPTTESWQFWAAVVALLDSAIIEAQQQGDYLP